MNPCTRTAPLKTAAVLPALGIGDALLMMIASRHLYQAGYQVTTFHDQLPELSAWFSHQLLATNPPPDNLVSSLSSFDLVIAENDNSTRIKTLLAAFQTHQLKRLSIFYPTYLASKHGPLTPDDQAFNPHRPMAENISKAIASLIPEIPDLSNGILPPLPLQHKKHLKRVLIHPTSREPIKNWTASKFLKLAQRLKQIGFEPHFCVSPSEIPSWEPLVKQIGCQLPYFPNLSTLAAYIYESSFLIGNDSLLGHLASNLNIPTLIIANDEKRMHLWRPGWLPGAVVLPPRWIPNSRLLRWKQKHWQSFISVRSVLQQFQTSCEKTF